MSDTSNQPEQQPQTPQQPAPEAPKPQGQGQQPTQPQQPSSPETGNGNQGDGQRGSSFFSIDAKDAKQMMSRPPQRISIISAILFFVVALFIGSQMMNMANSSETDTLITSEFVQAVEQDRVQNVVYDAGSYTVTGEYYPAATAGATASGSYNSAIEALNAQVQSARGSSAPTVETKTLESQQVGELR